MGRDRWGLIALLLLALSKCGSDDSAADEKSSVEVTADAGRADEATPSVKPAVVSGPIDGEPATAFVVDLDARGYSEKEFFFEGNAASYAVSGEMSEDGSWKLNEADRKPFKSRLLVRRPKDDSKFNGTVIVEWFNVSSGADGDPGFAYNFAEIMREGYAWVGVSAQVVGIQGGGFSISVGSKPLKEENPERYGELIHPGDAYSYDIFTQGGLAVRDADSVDLLEGLKPERLIAYGESQSAMRMVSYVDGVQPLAKVFDGFFIHSRAAAGTPFTDDGFGSLPGLGGGPGHLIRADLDAKVFQFQTETDVGNYLAARQPDSSTVHTWEVSGTAHADKYSTNLGGLVDKTIVADLGCKDINDGPQQFVIKAALHHLNQWLVDGTEPPAGEPIEMSSGEVARDEYGNARGGIRTPDVDVPIATHSGSPPPDESNFTCFLLGSTLPFKPERLKELYPTHEDYVAKVKEAASRAQDHGFLLAPEAMAMVARADKAAVPK